MVRFKVQRKSHKTNFIKDLVQSFADAAVRADKAGNDLH